MNILLTGQAGFIGKHLAPVLVDAGHRLNGSGIYIAADCVIHLAARTHIKQEFDPQIFESNVIYAKQMLSYQCRTLFASSTSAAELNNPYAYTKRYGEYLCSVHPNALALRLFNVYGHGCKRGIVKALIEAAFTGKEIEIQSSTADGHIIRDFIYVEDVCDIIMLHLTTGIGIIDVGTGIGTNIYDLVKIVQQISGRKININWVGLESGQQLHSIAEPLPGYSYTPLYHGLVKTVMAYKKENGV